MLFFAIMVSSFGLMAFQLTKLSGLIHDCENRSKDKTGVLFIVLNVVTNVAMVAANGKPYSSAVFSLICLGASLLISFICKILWEWCALFFAAAIPFLFSVQRVL